MYSSGFFSIHSFISFSFLHFLATLSLVSSRPLGDLGRLHGEKNSWKCTQIRNDSQPSSWGFFSWRSWATKELQQPKKKKCWRSNAPLFFDARTPGLYVISTKASSIRSGKAKKELRRNRHRENLISRSFRTTGPDSSLKTRMGAGVPTRMHPRPKYFLFTMACELRFPANYHPCYERRPPSQCQGGWCWREGFTEESLELYI